MVLTVYISIIYLGYKNLLRAVEYAGKAGIIGIEYLSTGLTEEKYESFLNNDVLR